jgi:hypothetical protein
MIMKKTYYCVVSKVDDNGNGCANLVDAVEAEEKPEDTVRVTARADIYTDWFESLEEAQEYVRTFGK